MAGKCECSSAESCFHFPGRSVVVQYDCVEVLACLDGSSCRHKEAGLPAEEVSADMDEKSSFQSCQLVQRTRLECRQAKSINGKNRSEMDAGCYHWRMEYLDRYDNSVNADQGDCTQSYPKMALALIVGRFEYLEICRPKTSKNGTVMQEYTGEAEKSSQVFRHEFLAGKRPGAKQIRLASDESCEEVDNELSGSCDEQMAGVDHRKKLAQEKDEERDSKVD